ncbi:hypothetical protein NGH74_13795 [Staphylococcus pseudoxylosus]|uniref:hypothetical protein n=1 Tax=Staphylococcus pseudoxylosus TaxID=2282419 RepID=UPI002DBB3167|nr:hypothetical protein [Staphylococcus pseudoxylosus]MEB8088233.1 hypothetical protein [Staphylococcus pseudoxylosus]
MSHNIEGDIRNCIEVANGDYNLSHLDEPMLNYYNELVAKGKAFDEIMKGELGAYYDKAKAWDNYENSVRSLVSKHADENTDIEKEIKDILCVYMEDE